MNRFTSILFTCAIIVYFLFLASSCKKEKSVIAVADFSYSGRIDTVPSTIKFINNSAGISFTWNFGDGSGSNEKNPIHTYNQTGTFKVKLVSKGTNNSDTLETVLVIGDYIPRNELVGWWPFNGNANDESGNGNHGLVIGANLTLDRFGSLDGAYDFDGLDDFIMLSDYPTSGNQSFSIFGWIYTPNTSTRKNIISYGSNNSLKGLWLYVANDNLLHFDLSFTFGPAAAVQIENNKWHHVGVVNNAGLIQLYIDGFASGSTQIMLPNILSGGKTIGSSIISDSGFFNGKIDDIGIWSRALTVQEITSLYYGGR